VAQSSVTVSRIEVKSAMQDTLRAQGCFMAESQARAERAGAKPFTAKPEGERGRMLGTNELHGARQLVKAKVHTSEYREEDSFGAPWDHEEEDLGEDEVDSLAHAAGREGGASAAAQPAIPGGSKPGFQSRRRPPVSSNQQRTKQRRRPSPLSLAGAGCAVGRDPSPAIPVDPQRSPAVPSGPQRSPAIPSGPQRSRAVPSGPTST
jgi:hypothetical protein